MINIDKYELYSFLVYLYFYSVFYKYVFEQALIKGIIINIFGNIFFYNIFNYHIFSFVVHKYWKNNLNTIAMPQLLTCLSNTIIRPIGSNYDYLIIIPAYYCINNMYKNEIRESKEIRFTISVIFFLYNLFF